MTQSEESRRLLPESSPVKIMEKVTHTLVVDNFPRRKGIGIGKSVESSPFTVGGFSFRIQLYPDGVDEETNLRGFISLYIKSDSPKAADVVYDLEILSHRDYARPYGHCSFGYRVAFHQIDTCLPASLGYSDFITQSHIRRFYGPNDSLWIRTTVGVVLDDDHHHEHQRFPIAISSSSSFERYRCIVFQVGDQRFFEKESVISSECPALVSDYPHTDHTVVISDIDPQVFMALLWFLNHKSIHPILDSRNMERDGLFALNFLAAAHKFHLKSLTFNICQYLLLFGNFQVLYRYSEINDTVKELWRKVSSWVPQKMKAT